MLRSGRSPAQAVMSPGVVCCVCIPAPRFSNAGRDDARVYATALDRRTQRKRF